MSVSIVRINSIDIPTGMDLVRHPPRDPKDQQAGYLDKFDFHGIFSDVFFSGSDVVAIGPPYFNLLQHLEESTFRLGSLSGLGKELVSFTNMDRSSKTVIKSPETAGDHDSPSSLSIEMNGFSLSTPIGPNEEEQFAGLNCLVTVSRDNPLETIHDWVEANVVANEIDGLLFFDNRSQLYGVNDLVEMFSGIDGLKTVVVVSWDVAFGVVANSSGNWDSDFGQYIAWEVARRRFLGRAKSVTINDVDEIALSEDGRPAWALAEESADGVFYCPMKDICPVIVEPLTDKNRIRRHRDFYFVDESPVGSNKYTYLPNRLRDDQQLKVHSVSGAGWNGQAQGYTRHFRGLHRRWRQDSIDYTSVEGNVSDGNFKKDDVLVRLFELLSWL